MFCRMLAAALALTTCARAAIVHVPGDQLTIQAGLDGAGAGDTVLVAPGVYSGEGNSNLDFGDPAIEDGISDWHPRWPLWHSDGPRSDMGAYGGPDNGGWLP